MKKSKNTANAAEIGEDLSQMLGHDRVTDAAGACNGLQVESSGPIKKIGAAVDSHEAVIAKAAERGIDFLIVHHGLFWDSLHPMSGRRLQKFKTLFDHNIAVFSSHLPLDIHPVYGNNILLARGIGLKKISPFYKDRGMPIGFMGDFSGSMDLLVQKVSTLLGKPQAVMAHGKDRPSKVGVVTGYATDFSKVLADGADTFITGEGPHWTYGQSLEAGLNVIHGGHYLTETLGVQAVARYLSEKWGIPWEFIDHPTGL